MLRVVSAVNMAVMIRHRDPQCNALTSRSCGCTRVRAGTFEGEGNDEEEHVRGKIRKDGEEEVE